MLYIKDIKEGTQIVDHYLCVFKQVLKTRVGKSYYSLKLQDKTGIVDAKVWDLNDGIGHFEVGDYIKIDGLAITFQGGIQINIRRVRKSEVGEFVLSDYLPTTEHDIEEMYQEYLAYIDKIENQYVKKLAEAVFIQDKQIVEKFKTYPAAKSVHHNFRGGLLEHTLGMLRLCEFVSGHYPNINRDLLYIGAMLHDVGKIQELTDLPMIEYSDEGQLVGHITIGATLVAEKIAQIPNFPAHIKNLVLHMILAHHGELEYGSPKKPAIIEAMVLHYIDNIDAKIMTFNTIAASVDQSETWLGYQRLFESNLRKTIL